VQFLPNGLNILLAKLRKLAAQFPYLRQAVHLVWSAAPRHAAVWTLLLAIGGVLPVATVYLTRSVVNSLVTAFRSATPWTNARPALILVAALALVLLLSEAVRGAAGWVRSAQVELVQDHISRLIHQKSLAVDLAFYDNAEYYDHLHRARSDASYRPIALLENLGGIFQNSITLVAMVAVLIPFGAWVPVALVVSTLPALYVVLRHTLDQHYWRVRATSTERRTSYYDWLLTADATAAELRLFNIGGHFQGIFTSLRNRLRNERLRLAKRQAIAEMTAGVFGLAAAAGALGWMAWRALHKQATLGDLAMFYQAFQQGLGLSRGLLGNVGQLYANALFLGNLFEFLSLEPKVVSPANPQPVRAPQQGIQFRKVFFRYPGAASPALNGIDLEIPAGRITAVVGANGAGKSTLLRLVCRFYDPDEGAVEWDRTNLRDLDLNELRRSISVLFQEPVHYNATAAENIAFGDIASKPDLSKIQAAAVEAGAAGVIDRFRDGYDHLLGRWFETGAELSTGEWQRVALARAFLRAAPVIVLDEPTSAMDPWAEADWLRRFRQLSAGRTAIVITHRFTTAMIADSIYVMVAGQVVERGSHADLIAADGLYAQGWNAQIRV
jgi:ATP-binding cassette subfamily B protein